MSAYSFEKFGRDPTAYDLGDGEADFGDGAPGIILFSNALQCWASCQAELVSVAQAAAAFRVPSALIIEAVEDHGWMFLSGPRDDYSRLMIEHDGE